jgi:CheY-like chemotaxis protein
MHGMNGFETTAQIRVREAGRGPRTPVIAITANVMLGSREKCVAQGLDDYLGKPFCRSDLRAVLERWLPRT